MGASGCTKCKNENFKLNDGECDRLRWTPAEAAKVLPVLDPRSLSWNKVVMKVARQGGTHTRQQYVDWIRKSYSISDNDMDLLLKQSGKVS